jgi:putative FmdB family regulatory protein
MIAYYAVKNMPTYEYEREDGTRFDHIASIKMAPLTRCPETGQKVKLVITGGTGTVFKGIWNDKKR